MQETEIAPGRPEAALLEEVSRDNLMEHTRRIAAEIRHSGSPEEAAAFAYIERRLKEYGIQTTLFHSDAYISVPAGAKATANGREFACITHAMATSTDGLTGELVYAGRGTPDCYRDLAVRGKVALLEGLAMGTPVKEAQDRGARALIFINADYTHEMIVSRVWGSPTPETFPQLPQIPVIAVNVKTGEMLKEMLRREAAVEIWLQTAVRTGWTKIPTLIGEISGCEEPEKFLLLSGHVDGWHYGAMDNASANAGMLEAARILQEHRGALKRSVRLAFWSGHSHGRYAGSTWYCDAHFEDLYEHCFMHVNVDSLGAKGAEILTEANCMAETRDLAAFAVKAVTGQAFEGVRFSRSGDQSFEGTGTPALFMGLSEQKKRPGLAAEAFAALFGRGRTGGFGWWWHTTEDTVDKIDPDNLARDCRVYLLAVYKACSRAVLPIDQRAAAREIHAVLEDYAARGGDKVDLALTLRRAARLEELVRQAYDAAKAAPEFNAYLMAMSRLLVPLNYVRGSIYDHDPAVRQASLPLLAEIDDLPSLDADSDAYKMMMVLLTRRINQVNHTLLKATRLTEALLA